MLAIRYVCVALCLGTLAGCHSAYPGRRSAQPCCPQDLHGKAAWWCGHDAQFLQPCGPSAEYFGYKPTCWGVWPTSAEEWRDNQCGLVEGECEEVWLLDDRAIDRGSLEPLPMPSGATSGWMHISEGRYCAVPLVKDPIASQPGPANTPSPVLDSEPRTFAPSLVASRPQPQDAPPTVEQAAESPVEAEDPAEEASPLILQMSYTVVTDHCFPTDSDTTLTTADTHRTPTFPIESGRLFDELIGVQGNEGSPTMSPPDALEADESAGLVGPIPTLHPTFPPTPDWEAGPTPSAPLPISQEPWAEVGNEWMDEEPSFHVIFKDQATSTP